MPIAYRFGVKRGSIPSLERKKRGVDAEIKVGVTAYKVVIGASDKEHIQEGKVYSVPIIERGE